MRSSAERVIDLNADVGEGPGESPLFEIVTSANIACGGHAGDEASMRAAVRLAQRGGVAIGAHPSYPDRAGFGRRTLSLPTDALSASIAAQIAALAGVARESNAVIAHVKPHGALYNDAVDDETLALAIADGVRAASGDAVVVGLAGSTCLRLWREGGLSVAAEGFADRAYDARGRLVPRTTPGALITDPLVAAAQAVRLAEDGVCATICIHSDTPGAAAIAAAVRRALEASGFTLRAPRG